MPKQRDHREDLSFQMAQRLLGCDTVHEMQPLLKRFGDLLLERARGLYEAREQSQELYDEPINWQEAWGPVKRD